MNFGQKGISGLVVLTVISFLILLAVIINYFIFPLEYLPYLIPNPIRQQQLKEVSRKATEKAVQEDQVYQAFKSSGVIIKPSYLPSDVGKPIEEKKLAIGLGADIIFGHSIDYTCNETPASLRIEYIPFSVENLRVAKELERYKTDTFIKTLINEGNMTFEEITINNTPAHYTTYLRSYRPYDTILGFETDKVTVTIWKNPDCRLSKEELIKIAESIR